MNPKKFPKGMIGKYKIPSETVDKVLNAREISLLTESFKDPWDPDYTFKSSSLLNEFLEEREMYTKGRIVQPLDFRGDFSSMEDFVRELYQISAIAYVTHSPGIILINGDIEGVIKYHKRIKKDLEKIRTIKKFLKGS